jgi:hypothetical protein
MPRNFDDLLQKDLSFTIRGETFEMVYVSPEVLSAWEDDKSDENSAEALKKLDQRILLFLGGNGDHERWKKLRARKKEPVTMGQINALLMWMIEVQAGRPTIQPSPSDSGRGRTAASSKAE